MRRLLLVAGVVLSLVTASCSSSAESDLGDDSVGDVVPSSVEAQVSDAGLVSLGAREAGFGPGSLAVTAAMVSSRLEAMVSSPATGDWAALPPYQYEARPAECGYAAPLALQGLLLSRQSPTDSPFGDAVAVEVSIYSDAVTASDQVAVLNGSTAAACDGAALDDALAQADGPTGVPGVVYDVGDGIGTEIPVPFDVDRVSSVAAREFSGTVGIGAEERDLQQLEWIVADGRFVIHSYALSATGTVVAIAAESADLLLAEVMPQVIPNEDLDKRIDLARTAVLPEGALPSYYEEVGTMELLSTVDTECYGEIQPLAIADGPSWINITPGVGGSEVLQSALVFSTPAEAEEAIIELRRLGTECFQDVIDLPKPMFSAVDSSFITTEVGGRQVVTMEFDYLQTINGTTFDVDADIALVQADEFVFSMRFLGLAGDSPNLQELVVEAAARIDR